VCQKGEKGYVTSLLTTQYLSERGGTGVIGRGVYTRHAYHCNPGNSLKRDTVLDGYNLIFKFDW
jgi:hypothetical protein